MSGMSDYCDTMRHSTSKRRKCKIFKTGACNETLKAKETRVFACGCGLYEAIVPIMEGSSCCGLIGLGMVRLKNCELEFPRAEGGCECCGTDGEEVSQSSVPEVDYSKLMDTAELVRVTLETLLGVYRTMQKRGVVSTVSDREKGPKLPEVQKNSHIYGAIKYFDTRLDEQISMKRMAQLCQLSESYFSKLFVRETGQSYVSWANDRKMEWAKYYLKNTKMSVHDISEALGFNDTSYFIKVFKKYCNTTPLAYRQDAKRN